MHSKTIIAAAAGLAILAPALAGAADLPSRSLPPVYAPPPPIPAFSWTGGYVGLHAGYQFGRSQNYAFDSVFGNGLGAAGANPDGIVGGGHVGYLFSTQSVPLLSTLTSGVSQLPLIGGLGGAGGVFGIEGDVDGSDYRRGYQIGAGLDTYENERIQGSIRGRLGFAVDRALFYATGGAAFGDLRNSFVNTAVGGVDSFERTRVGYTVGGGVEYSISNQVSLRAEYRYTDYGAFNSRLDNSTLGGVTTRTRETDNRVQGGVSYKFNGLDALGGLAGIGAPAAARY